MNTQLKKTVEETPYLKGNGKMVKPELQDNTEGYELREIL
jgi:hypothetical protein